ncbi:ribosomal protein S18-alanine N-acetyltransferase [Geomonas azotofigens]|uniref:ribosomal protein S18-alanine N-acetyltransferase n=1 Tax=Geomonas azotofigens TaxID=2843196 RepID=UPI001C0FE5C5|nr:ribosomal protein S18-alanine N-acetyltransferase [Geomonas azotofigens]MBU5613608.1 ribosomal protein S18-alanine N-acetyltransferase [Geomonas azotofigens]
MSIEDLDTVLKIESASFPRPWTRRHFLDEMEHPGSFPTVAATGDGEVAGYLCLKQVLDEAEILDVAVDPTFRGSGIGRALVDWAIAFCRVRKLRLLCLEVRVGNHEAISLYRHLGFAEVGRRKNYYENGDDAILMDLSIAQVEECDAV